MKLTKFNGISEDAYNDYISEWERSDEKIVPWATSRKYDVFRRMMHHWEEESTDKNYAKGFVPATLFFMLDDGGRIIGAIHFRHELNDSLRKKGGHIGYGIRPSERRKGYGKQMLAMFLDQLDRRKYPRVMITCDDENTGSAKIIEGNGGVLESRIKLDGNLIRRYWIELIQGGI